MTKWLCSTAIVSFLSLTMAHAITLPSPLVDSEWLSQNHDKVVILDVRKDLDSFVEAGHIANALLVNVKKIRINRIIDGIELTRMRPDSTSFENFMSTQGINNDSAVVITHQGIKPGNVAGAARLYWHMKYHGFDNVALLDGGNAAWVAALEELVDNKTQTDNSVFNAGVERGEILATISEVKSAMTNKQFILVDTRDLRQHIGIKKKNYVYEFGHIPGSKFFPYKLLHAEKGVVYFPTKVQIERRFKALNIDPNSAIILYCNSAYECSSVWFALHEIYKNQQVQVYDGSLHQWTKDTKNPMTIKIH